MWVRGENTLDRLKLPDGPIGGHVGEDKMQTEFLESYSQECELKDVELKCTQGLACFPLQSDNERESAVGH